jgi:hypothetical protein
MIGWDGKFKSVFACVATPFIQIKLQHLMEKRKRVRNQVQSTCKNNASNESNKKHPH